MFKNLYETIKSLNADVNNVANCEKAKKLRKKLLSIGLSIGICGLLGVFVCFAFAATAGFDAFGPNGPTARIMIPFLLFIPCSIVAVIGFAIASLGFKIVITGYTTDLINETIGNTCPNCGETLRQETIFCPKCGTKLKKECPNCKHVNDYKSEFCSQCGTKLD
ncbi:MAG: zinc ribbon domain-containing protein [Clostridia bacterium]|nr:zinc ribbon domain-containing protein [Clostridia bacterium]MBQ9514286.1 zinc ribbon domain-containing protein [Clostridia bacterium]